MGCPEIPNLSYAEFSERVHSQVTQERIPLEGMMELTHRCNFKCVQCYCNLPPDDKNAQKEELTTKEVFRILDEITEEGCLWLLFTGGEPLIREDFKEIYIYAKRKGIFITLFTNGSLITEEIANFLKDYPPFVVEISVYGATQKTYERITGKKDAFSRALRGIELLLERRIQLKLKTVAMTMNYNEFAEIKTFCEGLGVNFRFDPYIYPRIDELPLAPCRVRLSPEEVVRLDLADERRVSEYKKSYQEYDASQGTNFVYDCSGGIDNFCINPYGVMRFCEMDTEVYFNLRVGMFRTGWDTVIPARRFIQKSGQGECKGCRKRPLCGICPVWAKIERGNPEASIKYLCEIADLREEAFGLK